MPTKTLVHCQPVEIVSMDVPTVIVLALTVGGSPGDGAIEVTTTPPVLPDPIRLGTGGTSVTPLGAVLTVTVHYRRAGTGKPNEVELTHTP